jgi:hypothetical protein
MRTSDPTNLKPPQQALDNFSSPQANAASVLDNRANNTLFATPAQQELHKLNNE